MKSKILNSKWAWVFVLASIPFLGWSLRSTPLQEIIQTFSHLHLSQVIILAGVNVLVFLLIALRWEIILRAMGIKVPLSKLIGYRLTSFGVSYFTPGPQFGGEPAQVALLVRNHPAQTASAVSSVYLDKLLELLVNILVIAGGLFLTFNAGFGNEILRQNGWASVLLLASVPMAHLVALKTRRYPLKGLAEKSGSIRSHRQWVRKTGNLLVEAEGQIATFLEKNPKSLLLAILVSLISWAGMILEYSLVAQFLALKMSYQQVAFAFVLSRLAFLAPLPGGLGVLEASQVFAVQTLGMPAAFGLALSLWMRARDVLIGLIGLMLGSWMFARPVHSVQEDVKIKKWS
ncbi:MAG: lysylphosphatidylglycerol synthase transmembrane domain-containing protein [Bellilinea sp.]